MLLTRVNISSKISPCPNSYLIPTEETTALIGELLKRGFVETIDGWISPTGKVLTMRLTSVDSLYALKDQLV